MLQEALIAAHAAGKTNVDDATDRRWLAGVIRNQARLLSRGAVRQRERERRWHVEKPNGEVESASPAVAFDGAGLSPALRVIARLALSGLARREIAHLLDLTDEALRKRVSSLRKRLAGARIAPPEPGHGLDLDLAYGRLRQALLSKLRRQKAHFATHDPDGHLLVIRRV